MTYHVSFPKLDLDFTVNRIAFTVFGQNIYWYGVLIALGVALAMLFAFRYAKEFKIDTDKMVDVIMIGAVGAVICARAYYVVFAPRVYSGFLDIINIRDGGLAIYGGIIGALIFGILACKWRKISVLPMLDLAAMGFLIGQCIGRWGNFFNQEAFGTNTNLPWGMISEGTTRYLTSVQDKLAAQGVVVSPNLPVHPTFLYESLWCALGLFLLWFWIKHRKYDGQIGLMYVAWYGAGRTLIESLRTDSLQVGSFRASLMLGAISAVAAVGLLVYFRVKKPKTKTEETSNGTAH